MIYSHPLFSIKPKSIVYLFSGGKDSALALALTRDVVKTYAEATKCKVYIVHITVTGNTHPLNVYASGKVMYWHKKHYGFEPVFLARNKVFQEYMARYGLEIGSRRWCYLIFKVDVIREFEKRIQKPVVEIDGMKPSDSKHRAELIKSEFQLVEKSYGFRFWAWHPLFNFKGNPLEELRKYPEFKPIVKLYDTFGDSLNCTVCPYRNKDKLRRYHEVEDLSIVYDFIKETMRSMRWIKMFSFTKNKTICFNQSRSGG